MQAQFRAGSGRVLTTSALTYRVSMNVGDTPLAEKQQPLSLTGNEDAVIDPEPGLEVIPSSELASPLAPIRSVSFRSKGREHGDITPTKPRRPLR